MSVAGEIEVRVQTCGRSHTGRVREHNEDRFVVHDLSTGAFHVDEALADLRLGPPGLLLGVCDGMGGAAAGEEASRLGLEVVCRGMAVAGAPVDVGAIASRLIGAAEAANQRIIEEARRARSMRGMGTTGTFAVACGEDLVVGQVGDSRAYLCRGGRLVQLTRDQSLVNQLLEAGQLTPEEAKSFEHSNVILQALGTSMVLDVPLVHVGLRRGDTLLLCSDGLSGQLEDEEILLVLASDIDLVRACDELIERANDAGGVDNVTVVLARFCDGLREPTPEDVDRLAPTTMNAPEPTEESGPTDTEAASPAGEAAPPAAGSPAPSSPPEPTTPPSPHRRLAWLAVGAAVMAAGYFFLST